MCGNAYSHPNTQAGRRPINVDALRDCSITPSIGDSSNLLINAQNNAPGCYQFVYAPSRVDDSDYTVLVLFVNTELEHGIVC